MLSTKSSRTSNPNSTSHICFYYVWATSGNTKSFLLSHLNTWKTTPRECFSKNTHRDLHHATAVSVTLPGFSMIDFLLNPICQLLQTRQVEVHRTRITGTHLPSSSHLLLIGLHWDFLNFLKDVVLKYLFRGVLPHLCRGWFHLYNTGHFIYRYI